MASLFLRGRRGVRGGLWWLLCLGVLVFTDGWRSPCVPRPPVMSVCIQSGRWSERVVNVGWVVVRWPTMWSALGLPLVSMWSILLVG